jgi:hypothetical protein
MDNIQHKLKNLKIKGFRELEFFTKEIPVDLQVLLDKISININLNVDFFITEDKKTLSVLSQITYKYPDENKIEKLLYLDSSLDFTSDNFEDFVSMNRDGSFKFNDLMLVNLISITFGTIRGILIEKNKGLYLSKYILPPVDPNQILNAKKVKGS